MLFICLLEMLYDAVICIVFVLLEFAYFSFSLNLHSGATYCICG